MPPRVAGAEAAWAGSQSPSPEYGGAVRAAAHFPAAGAAMIATQHYLLHCEKER